MIDEGQCELGCDMIVALGIPKTSVRDVPVQIHRVWRVTGWGRGTGQNMVYTWFLGFISLSNGLNGSAVAETVGRKFHATTLRTSFCEL
jgi:hypothetical protein